MVQISKKGAKSLRDKTVVESGYGKTLADDMLKHLDRFHSIDRVWPDRAIETLLLEQKKNEILLIGKKPTYPKDVVKFNPSGASKTVMDLYLKAKGYKEQTERYPYHTRWTRNSTAVHEAIQRDLLYAEKKLKNPLFSVERLENGLPAWEDNILGWKLLEHEGQSFVLNGKMDGILTHEPTGKRVGFEFKTKSNTIAQVGDYLMKAPAPYHVEQCVAYYLLTGVQDYLLVYEAVAKPKWNAMADAKPDTKAFHVLITEEMATALLEKWAYVSKCVENDTPPEDAELGYFSGYGYLFEEGGAMNNG